MNRRAIGQQLADERGISLVLALLVLTFLAISLGSAIFFTAGNQSNANIQKAEQTARSLAEAGVNNAVSILSNPANKNFLVLPTLMPSSEAAAITAGDTKTGANAYQPGTTVTWWGNCDSNCGPSSSWLWTLHGKATVPNPTGAAPIVKTMTAQVQVHQPKPTNLNLGVWNTIYSPYGPTSGCDTTVPNQANVTVPLYVGGNLCVTNQGSVNAPVYVGGYYVAQSKNQSMIGSSSAPITSRAQPGANPAHIGGYCQAGNGSPVNPCKSEPTNPDTNIWVSMTGTWDPHVLQANMPDFKGVSAPQICWTQGSCAGDPIGGWYAASSPGPLHPCDPATMSGTPPTFDTGDGVMNQSVTSTFNLTPAASYTCKTAQGELSWNASTRTLTVYGTIFIDGSVTATTSGNSPVTYTGWGSCTTAVPCDGVIYVSGTVNITSENLCAKVSGNACDWANWDPNTKFLSFVANGQSSGIGISVAPSQTSFQGGLYATYEITTDNQAKTQGPLVSGTKVVAFGQQSGSSFPTITQLPVSLQGPPQAFWIDPPTNFSYGG